MLFFVICQYCKTYLVLIISVEIYYQRCVCSANAKNGKNLMQLTNKTWVKINDFLQSLSMENTVEDLNSKIMNELENLIPFENGGILIELGSDLRPVIKDSIRTERKWIELFHEYYYKISTQPDFDEFIYSADTHDLKNDEYANDFVLPQGINHSAGLIIFDHENKKSYSYVLNRSKSERTFSSEELNILKIIHPHITNYNKTAGLLEKFRRLPVMISELEMKNELLSTRESEIVYLLMQRFKPAEIADELKISVLTVRKHIQNIYEKIKVTDRQQLLQKVNLNFKKNGI